MSPAFRLNLPIRSRCPLTRALDASAIPTSIVKAIDVQGNKTISMSAILAKIKTRAGQEYIQSVISDDLKAALQYRIFFGCPRGPAGI